MADVERLSPKTPTERVSISINFKNLLKGTAIEDTEIVVADIDNGAPYPQLIETMLFGGEEGQEVFLMVVGGAPNHRYRIDIAAIGEDPDSGLGMERYEHILIQDVT